MRKLPFLTAALLLALVAPSHAGGVSLRWDNCYTDGGVANKTFACDANTGFERLVMSFVPDYDMVQVSGLESRLFVLSVSATLPAWWDFKNPGTCRLASLNLNTVQTGTENCVDWSGGTASGGIGSYGTGVFGPNGRILSTAIAVPPNELATIYADQEYFAGNLTINHAKTVGAGACGGCDQPVCIALDFINIVTPNLPDNQKLLDPAYGPGSDFAHWQNGQETNVQVINCDGHNFGCFHSFSCVLGPTPTRSSTWGAVKALYR